MQSYKYCFLLLLVLSMAGCKKEDPVLGFAMPYRQDFTIQPGLSVFAIHHFYLKDIPTRYNEFLTQNKKTDTDINRVIATQVNLSSIFGDGNFDFIEEASIRVYLESDPTDYLEFAYRYPVPLETGNNLGMIPGLANVKRFMSQERVSIDVSLRLRQTTPVEISARLDWQFKAEYQ